MQLLLFLLLLLLSGMLEARPQKGNQFLVPMADGLGDKDRFEGVVEGPAADLPVMPMSEVNKPSTTTMIPSSETRPKRIFQEPRNEILSIS